MGREIKFLAWRPVAEVMLAWEKLVRDYPEDIADIISGELFLAMQYTGLKDKNGREIYEGDILQPSAYTKSSIARSAVTFHKGYFCLGLAPPYVTAKRPLNLSLENSNKAENGLVVIGNIYENPELLAPPLPERS